MTDTFDKDVIATAFRIAANDAGCSDGNGYFEINGYTFNLGEPHDEDILALLALSPTRGTIDEMRDMLNRALGEPEETLSDLEEVRAAQAVLEKHLMSGFVEHVVWIWSEAELHVTLRG